MPLPRLFKGIGGGAKDKDKDKPKKNSSIQISGSLKSKNRSLSALPSPTTSTSKTLPRASSPSDVLNITGYPKTNSTVTRRTIAPHPGNGTAPPPNPVSRFTEHSGLVTARASVTKTPEPTRPTASPPQIVMPKPRPSLVPARRVLRPEHFDKTQVESEDEVNSNDDDQDDDGSEGLAQGRDRHSSEGDGGLGREDSPAMVHSQNLAALGGNLANVQHRPEKLGSPVSKSSTPKNKKVLAVVTHNIGSPGSRRTPNQGDAEEELMVSPLSDDSFPIPPSPRSQSSIARPAGVGSTSKWNHFHVRLLYD